MHLVGLYTKLPAIDVNIVRMSPFPLFLMVLPALLFICILKNLSLGLINADTDLKGTEKWRILKFSDLNGTICPKRN